MSRTSTIRPRRAALALTTAALGVAGGLLADLAYATNGTTTTGAQFAARRITG